MTQTRRQARKGLQHSSVRVAHRTRAMYSYSINKHSIPQSIQKFKVHRGRLGFGLYGKRVRTRTHSLCAQRERHREYASDSG